LFRISFAWWIHSKRDLVEKKNVTNSDENLAKQATKNGFFKSNSPRGNFRPESSEDDRTRGTCRCDNAVDFGLVAKEQKLVVAAAPDTFLVCLLFAPVCQARFTKDVARSFAPQAVENLVTHELVQNVGGYGFHVVNVAR